MSKESVEPFNFGQQLTIIMTRTPLQKLIEANVTNFSGYHFGGPSPYANLTDWGRLQVHLHDLYIREKLTRLGIKGLGFPQDYYLRGMRDLTIPEKLSEDQSGLELEVSKEIFI